jgi:hypothetical protein
VDLYPSSTSTYGNREWQSYRLAASSNTATTCSYHRDCGRPPYRCHHDVLEVPPITISCSREHAEYPGAGSKTGASPTSKPLSAPRAPRSV